MKADCILTILPIPLHPIQLIHGLSLLRFRAPDAWLVPFLAAAHARLPYASPNDCCRLVGALARLGCANALQV